MIKASQIKAIRQHEPTILTTGNTLCKEYSEEPEKLDTLLKSIEIEVMIKRPIKSKHSEENLLSLPVEVTIKRGKKEISFDWFASHNDAMCYIDEKTFSQLTKSSHYTKSKSMNRFGKGCYDGMTKLGKKQLDGKREFTKSLKYSILASVQCEYWIEPIFEDFCMDFGYEKDSRKAFELWQTCLKHSQKLQTIFTSDDVEVMPS
tara:strand:- start:13891 stop:14502 length:612 start_codon:yes stop_codon:yes gene_type:complete